MSLRIIWWLEGPLARQYQILRGGAIPLRPLYLTSVFTQVLLVGDSGVGKSSLLMRFTADAFDESSAPTIGTGPSSSPRFVQLYPLLCQHLAEEKL